MTDLVTHFVIMAVPLSILAIIFVAIKLDNKKINPDDKLGES